MLNHGNLAAHARTQTQMRAAIVLPSGFVEKAVMLLQSLLAVLHIMPSQSGLAADSQSSCNLQMCNHQSAKSDDCIADHVKSEWSCSSQSAAIQFADVLSYDYAAPVVCAADHVESEWYCS